MRTWIRRFDSSVTDSITSWSASLKSFFLFVTALGDPLLTVTIGLVVVIWGVSQSNVRLALAGATVWLTLGLGSLLKMFFARVRPETDYAANMLIQTFSFPSGHTSGATIAYGLLAYFAWHLLPHPWGYVVTALLIGLIVLVGISRVYLGAHYPSDVVAGWLLGSIALIIVIFVIKPLA